MSQQRDPRFDNLRGLGILLVVFGHVVANPILLAGKGTQLLSTISTALYSFHMPLFIFISGYFSKKSEFEIGYFTRLVKNYLLPFILVNTVLWLITSRELSTLLYPQYTMWYLLSLFFWKLLVYAFSRFRASLLLAVLLSLYIGITPADQFLALSRTIGLFPFFLAGQLFSTESLDRLQNSSRIISGWGFILGVAAICFLTRVESPDARIMSYLNMATPYPAAVPALQSVGLKLITMLISTALVLCLIALAPSKRSVLTELGVRSMPVYLLHGLTIKLMAKVLSRFELVSEPVFILIAMFVTIAICAIFGNKYVHKMYLEALNAISNRILKS